VSVSRWSAGDGGGASEKIPVKLDVIVRNLHNLQTGNILEYAGSFKSFIGQDVRSYEHLFQECFTKSLQY